MPPGVTKYVCLVAVVVLPLTGCGTAAVVYDREKRDPGRRVYVYGGVVTDIVFFLECLGRGGEPPADLSILDVPFSIVCDTAFLPVFLWWQIDRLTWSEKRFAHDLRQGDPDIRRRAVHDLGRWEKKTGVGFNAHLGALDDEEIDVRKAAAYGLHGYGPRAVIPTH